MRVLDVATFMAGRRLVLLLTVGPIVDIALRDSVPALAISVRVHDRANRPVYRQLYNTYVSGIYMTRKGEHASSQLMPRREI